MRSQISPAILYLIFTASVAARTCTNLQIPLELSAQTAVFNVPKLVSNSDATAFIQNVTRYGQNFTETALAGYKNTSGKYHISAQFCIPEAKVQNPVLQILTHGLGFDKSYWDFPFDNYNYSYVDVATDQYKYCTFSYDRLGFGQSSHGDPVNEIQASLEVAVLAELTILLRESKVPEIKQAFSKVIHVGHSFGSALTYALISAKPTISDGAVLTGFSLNNTFIRDFHIGANYEQAYLNQPFRFGDISVPVATALKQPHTDLENKSIQQILDEYVLIDFVAGLEAPSQRVQYASGYLTNADASANQFNFFLPGYFDPEILQYSEKTKQPIAPGEILTSGAGLSLSNFQGPVLVITGSNDLPFCGGDCFATGNPSLPSIPAAMIKAFPKIKPEKFAAYIQPNMGHSINLHYNATGAYMVINGFLKKQGLASA